jgi:hypothetical protein
MTAFAHPSVTTRAKLLVGVVAIAVNTVFTPTTLSVIELTVT